MKNKIMKKLSLYIFLVLMFCNVGFAKKPYNEMEDFLLNESLDYNFDCREVNNDSNKMSFGFYDVTNNNANVDFLMGLFYKQHQIYPYPLTTVKHALPEEIDLDANKFKNIYQWTKVSPFGIVKNTLLEINNEDYYMMESIIITLPEDEALYLLDLSDYLQKQLRDKKILNIDRYLNAIEGISNKIWDSFFKYENNVARKTAYYCENSF
jgi:hypothetical protein